MMGKLIKLERADFDTIERLDLIKNVDLEPVMKRIEALEASQSTKRELSTIKADITRIKKKVYQPIKKKVNPSK